MIRRRKQDKQAAVAAWCRASAQLEAARAREPEVKRLTATMRHYGDKNHFLESLNMHVKRRNP